MIRSRLRNVRSILAAFVAIAVGSTLMLCAQSPRVHPDAGAVEEAVLEATRQWLRADLGAVVPALEALQRVAPPIDPDSSIDREVRAYDQAFQLTLQESLDLARSGDNENGWKKFLWVIRSCRRCHEMSRQRGVMAPAKPSR